MFHGQLERLLLALLGLLGMVLVHLLHSGLVLRARGSGLSVETLTAERRQADDALPRLALAALQLPAHRPAAVARAKGPRLGDCGVRRLLACAGSVEVGRVRCTERVGGVAEVVVVLRGRGDGDRGGRVVQLGRVHSLCVREAGTGVLTVMVGFR